MSTISSKTGSETIVIVPEFKNTPPYEVSDAVVATSIAPAGIVTVVLPRVNTVASVAETALETVLTVAGLTFVIPPVGELG